MTPPGRFRQVRKVGAITTDWSASVWDGSGLPAMGGAGHARIGQVARLSKHRWVVGRLIEHQPALGVTTWDGSTHFDCDVVVLQRHMDLSALRKVQRARERGAVVINDVDDWFWGLHPENAAYVLTDPKVNLSSNIDIYKAVLSLSTVIVVSTNFLAEQFLQWWPSGPEIVVIANGVDLRSFYERRHHHGAVTVGWAGSTAHRSGDLQILRSVFAQLSEVKFFHLGANPHYPQFHDVVGLPERAVATCPMLAPHEYPAGFRFDIGVVPLVDIPFNRAKSNIKGLEYAASGIPFVASPLPEYVKLAEEHGIGRLASTAKDWQREIRALCDHDTRVAEARRQREAVAALGAKAQAREWDELVWRLR